LNLAGRTAVVTGAAGGIGRAIAVSLAARGCHLALADVDAAGLEQTRALTEAQARAPGVAVSLHPLDVGDKESVAAMPSAVAQRHTKVDLLFNNAGVAIAGSFEEVSEADFEWLFNVNFWGVVRMTRAFLPVLRRSDDARIVNLSSLFGLISPPGQAAYSASKFAVRGFCNALRFELQGSSVAVTVVHPGGVATSIAKNARKPDAWSAVQSEQALARIQKMLRMPPEKAGEIIVQGVERRKARIVIGAEAKLASAIERLMPVSYWRILARRRR
jgi:short-subunit dehydrogenase